MCVLLSRANGGFSFNGEKLTARGLSKEKNDRCRVLKLKIVTYILCIKICAPSLHISRFYLISIQWRLFISLFLSLCVCPFLLLLYTFVRVTSSTSSLFLSLSDSLSAPRPRACFAHLFFNRLLPFWSLRRRLPPTAASRPSRRLPRRRRRWISPT